MPARTGRELEDHGDITNPRGGFVMGENKAREFDRRRFLKTTAAASLGTAATASLGRHHRRVDGTGGGRRAGPHPAPRRRTARAWTWSPRAPPLRVASGSCSRTSRHTRRRIRCSTAWVRPWRKSQPPTPPVPRGQKDQNDSSNENPNPVPDVRVHLRRPVRRPRHHLRHHAPQRAAVRPLRNHQLPHPPLRPRRHLRAGPRENPQFYNPTTGTSS